MSAINQAEEIKKQLSILTIAFNSAFTSHRKFALSAPTDLLEGKTVAIYSGSEEAWNAMLEVQFTDGELQYTLQVADNLPTGMTVHLHRMAEQFENNLVKASEAGPHKR